MKKLLAVLLALMMMLSLTACGGGEYADAAKEIEKITGEKTSADDVKEAIKEMEKLTGEKMTVDEFVEFTKGMYSLANGDWSDYEPEDDEWPFADIPAWPVTEGLEWSNYYGDNQYDIYVTGGEEEMESWLKELREVGFNGYFWDGDELEYYTENCNIYLDDRGADEGEYHLVVIKGEMDVGLPEEIEGLFPDYNGDGVLLYSGMDEYDGEKYYYFDALGETEEGGKRYLQVLIDDGFEAKNDFYYSGAGGYYYKTENGKTIGYASEEYWYEFDDETQTGWANFFLTVKP